MPKPRIAVFASGRGSNFGAICEAIAQDRLSAEVVTLVTNVCGSGACEIANQFDIPVLEAAHGGLTRAAHEQAILDGLKPLAVDWIVLAGYMRLFTPGFIAQFRDPVLSASRIVNIHPSLLPSFPGKDGYTQAVRYGVKVTGVTVHLVGEGLDDGPVIAQAPLEVRDDDTEESLLERGLRLEHKLYPETLQKLFTRPWRVTTGTDLNGRPRVEFGS